MKLFLVISHVTWAKNHGYLFREIENPTIFSLPGGHEHGEVNAFNGPGSNSFSSSYHKSQSFGNISPSYGSSSSSFSSGGGGVSPDASVALANHNAILTNMQRMHQDNMMSMGMGVPTTIYGTHKFSPYADPPVVIGIWMDQHMKFMENMMKFQQKQFEVSLFSFFCFKHDFSVLNTAKSAQNSVTISEPLQEILLKTKKTIQAMILDMQKSMMAKTVSSTTTAITP